MFCRKQSKRKKERRKIIYTGHTSQSYNAYNETHQRKIKREILNKTEII